MIDLAKTSSDLFPRALESNLRRLGPLRKLHNHFLDALALRLAADCVFLVSGRHANRLEEGKLLRGDAALWDEALVASFLAGKGPALGQATILSSINVHGRQLAIVGAVRRDRAFTPAERRTLDKLAGVLVAELGRREAERLDRVLDRIREKIVSELRPRDLAYQILDGLHQLVDYDHSSALLTWDQAAGCLRIEAEKIVWTKAKSAFVGHEIPVAAEMVERLSGASHAAAVIPGDPLAEQLDWHRGQNLPSATSLLWAPLFFGREFLGLLKIAARKRHPFDRRDVAVVERFLPAAAVSIRNARLNMSLTKQAMQAELKAGLVTLARAVAHDVNNAVGTILPLAQQVRADLEAGSYDPEVLRADLDAIVDKAVFCKRIFANMLRVAGPGRPGSGPIDVNQVVQETLPFLQGQAARQGVEVRLDLDPDVPCISFSRQHLEHIVLNLVSNSLEAMAERGSAVTITTRVDGDTGVALTVADDGPGIAADILEQVQEPFFTTKSGGTGLGLAIVRSLAWQNRVEIESDAGAGARVTVGLRSAPPGSRTA